MKISLRNGKIKKVNCKTQEVCKMTDKDKCSCGCENHDHNHDHEFEDGVELDTIYLTFEGEDGEDEEVECGILGFFDVEDQNYIALVVPAEEGEEGDLEEEIYIYKYDEDVDGEPLLDIIETEEEFNKVNEVFEREFFEDEE